MNLCDCTADGHCQRYQRDMSGRMRELCAGINVDLGAAAAFRAQWAREARAVAPSAPPVSIPKALRLTTHQAPGDAVAMTAAIHSLHRAHPGAYLTAVESDWPEVFEHNPDVTPVTVGDCAVEMHYPAVHESNERGIHFMQGWCEFLGEVLRIAIPLTTSTPKLYFKEPTPPADDFWIVCSGGKEDFTNKLWGHHCYQEVVTRLWSTVRFIQVGGGGHNHQPLAGAQSMVGKTSLRQLFDLVRRARGVLCGVSLLMHVAAALGKPAIVIAGGREPVQWNAYPMQQYMHTVGALPCVSTQGMRGGACWRSRVLPLGDNAQLDKDPCLYPVNGTPTSLEMHTVPACMHMIRPHTVADAVARYNERHKVPYGGCGA